MIVETEYQCQTCHKSIIITTEIMNTIPMITQDEAKAHAAESSSKSPLLAAFAQKHSQHRLRQYTELEAIG